MVTIRIVLLSFLFTAGTSTAGKQVEEDGILVLTKHRGINEVTVSRQPPSWMHSTGSVGSDPNGKHYSRKLQQSNTFFERVVGNDSRRLIEDTTIYPWRAIGVVQGERPGLGWERQTGLCSGALISPRHVLTSAHCLWDEFTNNWFKDYRFIPGKAGEFEPYKIIKYVSVSVPREWQIQVPAQADKFDAFDYGILELEEDIGNQLGYFSFGYNCSQINYQLNIAGYPGDLLDGKFLYYATCNGVYLDACLSNGVADLYGHRCDTASGMSGGPMWVRYPDTEIREIRGVHKGAQVSQNMNVAVYVSSDLYDFIQDLVTSPQPSQSNQNKTLLETSIFSP